MQSMFTGQRHLEDLGYEVTDERNESRAIQLEEQLAPWLLSKNFIEARQVNFIRFVKTFRIKHV